MKLLHFDSHIAGAKTLWILLFQKDNETPSVDFLIPAPFDPNEWIIASRKIKQDHLDALAQFQNLCKETATQCRFSKDIQASAEKLKQVTEEINHFTLVLKIFQEIMKRFNPEQNSKNDPPSN